MEFKKDNKIVSFNDVHSSPFDSKSDVLFLNFSKGEPTKVRIIKRTLRITEALFLVTDNINQSETIRTKARSESLNLFESAVAFVHESTEAKRHEFLRLLTTTVGFLEIAAATGLVSSMNVRLIADACELLSQSLSGGTPATLDTSFFIEKEQNETPPIPQVADKETLRETRAAPRLRVPKNETIRSKVSGRRDTIVAVLKQKPQVSVKDITAVIPGVSEKTIQRELLALVSEGVLKKEGERRWSTYSLK